MLIHSMWPRCLAPKASAGRKCSIHFELLITLRSDTVYYALSYRHAQLLVDCSKYVCAFRCSQDLDISL